MSFGFLGIQFGFALQNANMSRIFQTLGAELDEISILWLAAPTTGLLVQPVIGYMSDRTWNRLGRRKPYFLVGAILASLALIVMPSVTALWVAAGLLWILDASINVSMEPFRALVADMLPPEQRTTGFAVQSFFIGTGAVIASALPYVLYNWLDVSNTSLGEMGLLPGRFCLYYGRRLDSGTHQRVPAGNVPRHSRERAAACQFQHHGWFPRDHGRLRQNAQDDGAAGFCAILLVAGVVCHVALYHGRRYQPRVRHHRYHF
jgi:MFS family permease